MEKERRILAALDYVLGDWFYQREYSLNQGFKERAYCLEKKEDGTWEIYVGERGLKESYRIANTIELAVTKFIHSIARSDADAKQIEEEYKLQLENGEN